jgi:hypothetical protein
VTNTARDISVSGVCSIHDFTSDRGIVITSVSSLFQLPMDSWFVAFENIDHGTTHEHKTLSIFLSKSPSEALRTLEEAHGKEVVKKTQVYEWHKRFRDVYETAPSSAGQNTCTSVPGVSKIHCQA